MSAITASAALGSQAEPHRRPSSETSEYSANTGLPQLSTNPQSSPLNKSSLDQLLVQEQSQHQVQQHPLSHHQPPIPDPNNNQNLQQFNTNEHSFKSLQSATPTTTTTSTTNTHQMHVCGLCDKLLSSSSSLDRHMLTHSGERPFVCKRCHMTFTTNGNMHRHMRTHLHKDSIARQQQEQQLKSSTLEPTHQAAPSLPITIPALASQVPDSLNIGLPQTAQTAAPQLLNQMVNFQDLTRQIVNPAGPAALVEGLNFHDSSRGVAPMGAVIRADSPQNSVSAFLNQLLVAASNFHQIKSTLEANNQQPSVTKSSLNQALNPPASLSTMSMMDSPKQVGPELANRHLDSPQPFGSLSLNSPQQPESLSLIGSPPPLQTPQHHLTTCLDSPQHASMTSSPPDSPHEANLSVMMDSPSRQASLLSVDSPQPGSLSIDFPQPLSLSADPHTTLNPDHEDVVEDISQSYVKTANPNAARKGGKRNRHCYKCKLCTYSSVDRCTLERHLRIHTGERPYICGICKYAFTTKANCERHVRKRHKRQYNSLGGPGGGGIKGSNGGGRRLIITDHSNHQTIPVKVNPVAAQTISQTLQRIQDKHQQTPSDMEMDNIERLSGVQGGGGTQRVRKQQYVAQYHRDQDNLYQGDSSGNYQVCNVSGNKSKRKQRDHNEDDDEDSLEHTSSFYQSRLIDKHDSAQLLSRKKMSSDRLSNSSFQINQRNSLLDQVPKIGPNNELFTNLVALLQQVKGGQQESSATSFNPGNNPGEPGTNLTNSATYLATMLAAAKSLRASQQEFEPDDRLQQPSRSSRFLSSPETVHEQLCKPNSQQPFFIRRNPFDAFNDVDLAAQALDLSCKFQSSK